MQHIKKIYLYAVSLISLVMLVIGAVILINLALKTWVFPKADQAYTYYSDVCGSGTSVPAVDNSVKPDCSAEAKAQRAQEEQDRRTGQKQSDAAQAVAMILVAAPVFYFHWRLAKKLQ
jgi:hypothetical protein